MPFQKTFGMEFFANRTIIHIGHEQIGSDDGQHQAALVSRRLEAIARAASLLNGRNWLGQVMKNVLPLVEQN